MFYDAIINHPESPHVTSDVAKRDGVNKITFEDFNWAFNIVSSRTLTLNNQFDQELDEDGCLMILPLLDYLNHSPSPNCVAVPLYDKLYEESFVELKAIKDIKKDDQLTISYGNLPNSHLI